MPVRNSSRNIIYEADRESCQRMQICKVVDYRECRKRGNN